MSSHSGCAVKHRCHAATCVFDAVIAAAHPPQTRASEISVACVGGGVLLFWFFDLALLETATDEMVAAGDNAGSAGNGEMEF